MAITPKGIITTDFSLATDMAYGSVIQADGKFLTVGASGNTFVLARYNSNGSLDSSFNGDGSLNTLVSYPDFTSSVIVQPDGKLVVAGYKYSSSINTDFNLVRYNSNGSLDASFDGDGKVTTAVGTLSDFANSVLMQSDGKLVVAGYSYNSSGNKNMSLVRYNSNGSLDSSFNGTGKIITSVGSFPSEANVVIAQANGKLVVAGYSFNSSGNTDFALLRYNSNGSLDTTFDLDGKVTTSLGAISGYVNAVVMQADGKIVAAGYSSNATGNNDFVLVRYNANGSLDTSFDGDGKVITSVGAFSDYANSIIVQPDGKLVVAGYSYNASAYKDFSIVRYNANGSLDTSFDTDGKVITSVSNLDDYAQSVVLQADGKLLVTGTSNNDFALVRYNSNGSLDTSFTGSVNHAPTGAVTINDSTPEQGQQLTVSNTLADADNLGTITYQWKTVTTVLGSGDTYTVTANEVGKTISVLASYTDGLGNAESVSSATTSAVIAVNHAPTGSVTISGDAILGRTLTANNTLADADGLGAITYQWKTGTTVLATGNTYKLTANELGKIISLTANYTDGLGHTESVSSANSNAVTDFNYAPTGNVTITGNLIQGQILTANNNLADLDGLGAITYQWKTGTTLLGTGNTYTLSTLDIGKTINVTATYTDGLGHIESVTSLASNVITAINHLPTGIVSIAGTATQGRVLSAHHNLVDVDGLGVITYQWQADSTVLATGNTYRIAATDVGKTITVTATYLDNADHQESKTSPATALIGINTLGTASNDELLGTPGYDALNGAAGNDTLTGGLGKDLLIGGSGHDVLYGAESNDILQGGLGNDVLFGGDSNDRLEGEAGADTLTGGAGKDIFVFNAIGVDTITDFNSADDVIRLDKTIHKIFTSLLTAKNTVLISDEFVVNATALDSNDHIIYNNNTGVLFYDADGNGAGAAVKIALLGNHAALTAADFVVI